MPANAARLRLMRLTEAAENLRSRAAMSIQVGKETEARELLIQKKKLMQALKKSKNRIEVLDKLSSKINEVKIHNIAGLLCIFALLFIKFVLFLLIFLVTMLRCSINFQQLLVR